MQSFPLTLAAIKTADRNQWAIGDALIKECGPPSEHGVNDGSQVRLTEAAKYLLGEGYEIDSKTLSRYRIVAHSFGVHERRSFAWQTHEVAGTPEFLNAVIIGAPKGTRITANYVTGIRQQQADKERREREEAAEKARAVREKAEQEEAQAKARARKAKEKKEKETAEAELAEAKAKTEAARTKEEEVKTAPKKKTGPPKEEDVPLMAIQAEFIANAANSVRLARLSVKNLKRSLDQLNAKGVAALTEAALEAANAWTEAARLVRSEIVEQSNHLSVVGE